MFKTFVAGLVSFGGAIALSRGNSLVGLPNLWYAILAAVIAIAFTKGVFALFGVGKEIAEGKPKADGSFKVVTLSNVIALFSGAVSFLFSILE
jgi:hypothetical protein